MRENEERRGSFWWNCIWRFSAKLCLFHACSSLGQWPGKSVDVMSVTVSVFIPTIYEWNQKWKPGNIWRLSTFLAANSLSEKLLGGGTSAAVYLCFGAIVYNSPNPSKKSIAGSFFSVALSQRFWRYKKINFDIGIKDQPAPTLAIHNNQSNDLK